MEDQPDINNTKSPIASGVFWLTLTPILGALGYSSLYLIGVIYHQTYLTHFGISPGFFEKSSTDYFVHAYSALLQIGTNWLSIISNPIIFFSVLGLALLFISEIFLLNWLPTTAPFKTTSSKIYLSKRFKVPAAACLLATAVTFLLLALPLVANLLLIVPALIGAKSAETSYKREELVFDQGCERVKKSKDYCVRLLDREHEVVRGFIIEISSSHIALYLDGKATILPLKNYRIETLTPSVATATTQVPN